MLSQILITVGALLVLIALWQLERQTMRRTLGKKALQQMAEREEAKRCGIRTKKQFLDWRKAKHFQSQRLLQQQQLNRQRQQQQQATRRRLQPILQQEQLLRQHIKRLRQPTEPTISREIRNLTSFWW